MYGEDTVQHNSDCWKFFGRCGILCLHYTDDKQWESGGSSVRVLLAMIKIGKIHVWLYKKLFIYIY